ncbi:hypothetical protein ACUOFC_27250, partial [Escherichia sp. TWPC-MK]
MFWRHIGNGGAIRQHSDNETETKRECSVVIPDDWQLTSQQQAFIELFAEDD